MADAHLSVARRGLMGSGCALICALAVACAASPASQPATAPPVRPAAAAFPDDPAPLPKFHSKRFSLHLPLPDGKAWRIDDHTRPELVATHPPTRSKVVVAVLHADELVGRSQCEALARDRGLVPKGDLRTLEEETGITLETYDTRTVVAVETGSQPDQPLVGHVMAFGGFLRKCFVFDFSTQVDGAADEPVLSQRLAFARARILGGIAIDPLGTVEREKPVGPDAPPPFPGPGPGMP